jgi:hypothetical protein
MVAAAQYRSIDYIDALKRLANRSTTHQHSPMPLITARCRPTHAAQPIDLPRMHVAVQRTTPLLNDAGKPITSHFFTAQRCSIHTHCCSTSFNIVQRYPIPPHHLSSLHINRFAFTAYMHHRRSIP